MTFIKTFNFHEKLFEGFTSVLIKEEISKNVSIKIPQILSQRKRITTFEFYKTNPQLVIKKGEEIRYVFLKGILYNIKSQIQQTF